MSPEAMAIPGVEVKPGGEAGPGSARLIGLDVDGTLMTYDEFMSEEVRGVIARLRQAGHHVVLATGRPLVATLPVARILGIETGWVVCSNGSVTARLDPALPDGFELEHTVMFDARDALDVMGRHMPEAKIALEEIGVGYWITDRFPGRVLHGLHSVVDFRELRDRETARIVVADADQHVREFDAEVAGLGLVATQFTIAQTRWMDVAPIGITKAYALERLRNALGACRTTTLAIGDGDNDIEMLRWAGYGVAMGHADAQVIAAADQVTGSILDDGAVPILEAVL